MIRDQNKNEDVDEEEANAKDIEEEVKNDKFKPPPAIPVNVKDYTDPITAMKQNQKQLVTPPDPYVAPKNATSQKKDTGGKFSEFLIAEK